VTINGCEGSRSREANITVEWDVRACIGVPIFLRQSKINQIYQVRLIADAHYDVAWFEVAVNVVAGMNVL
jgi:hypothetical protein